MAHFLFRAHYTQAGIQGVLKEGAANRVKAMDAVTASVGGRVETCYWAFGDDDFVLIADLPSNAAAAAIATSVSASGAAGVSTTVLLTAAEVDEARGIGVQYRAPGS
ncbi:MAG: GYD domain-containing protein [Chloroflexi bacterium]|nr:GYD domain-containing protein [Chloroflexota bacterium]